MRKIHHSSPSHLCQFFNLYSLRGEKLFFQYYALQLILLYSNISSSLKIARQFPLTGVQYHISQLSFSNPFVSHFIPILLTRISRHLIVFFHITLSFFFRCYDFTHDFSTLKFSPTPCSYCKGATLFFACQKVNFKELKKSEKRKHHTY